MSVEATSTQPGPTAVRRSGRRSLPVLGSVLWWLPPRSPSPGAAGWLQPSCPPWAAPVARGLLALAPPATAPGVLPLFISRQICVPKLQKKAPVVPGTLAAEPAGGCQGGWQCEDTSLLPRPAPSVRPEGFLACYPRPVWEGGAGSIPHSAPRRPTLSKEGFPLNPSAPSPSLG